MRGQKSPLAVEAVGSGPLDGAAPAPLAVALPGGVEAGGWGASPPAPVGEAALSGRGVDGCEPLSAA